jgi:hypothetical protein
MTSDGKCYVVYVEHIIYGTEIVGVCVNEPSTQQMQDMAQKYINRYTFDERPDSLELEYKKITKIGYVISPIVC